MQELGPLQVIPQGLTGFLQLKVFGQGLGAVSSLLEANLDVRDWLFCGRRQATVQLFNVPIPNINIASATPSQSFFQASGGVVPQGQTWWVDRMTLFVSLAAADTISFCPIIGTASGTDFFAVGPKVTDTITARARGIIATNDRPFFMNSGDMFGVSIFDNLAGVQTNIQLRVLATVLPN
jgi:hypothetical protein